MDRGSVKIEMGIFFIDEAYLTAFGITLSYVEVIFFLGRYPNLGKNT